MRMLERVVLLLAGLTVGLAWSWSNSVAVGDALPARNAAFQNAAADGRYRIDLKQSSDPGTERLVLVQTVHFRGPAGQDVVIEKNERIYERGGLMSVEQTVYHPSTGKLISKSQANFNAGILVRDDRVLYKNERADQWFLHAFHDNGRRERMQYGNYYQPFVSLQARDIELYRDDLRNTKHHSEVRDYFPNPEIGDIGSDKFNIEMCHHKREWEVREDGSPHQLQYNEYGKRLVRVEAKLEHQHVRQINIDYAPDGTVKPDGYREWTY